MPSVAAFTNLFLEAYRDDGVAVYLNGAEIYRSNLTNGAPLTYLSFCTNATDNGSAIQSATLPLAQLLDGTNVLAAEVHQSSAGSSDLVFDLQLKGNPVPPPPLLKHLQLGGQLVLYWDDGTMVLEEAPELTGLWTPVAGTSPIAVSYTGAQRFFRLRQ